MTKLIVFDFDSTLMDGECINIVLNQIINNKDHKQQLEALRSRSMSGEIPLEVSLQQRIEYLKGLPTHILEEICLNLPWMLNAKDTITELKHRGFFTVCLSGAFRTATRRVICDLGIDAYCSNTLEINNKELTGVINGNLMTHHSKGDVLLEIQNELNISTENTVAVGDGANDLSMFQHASTKIAFCATSILNDSANCIIDTKDLSQVLQFID